MKLHASAAFALTLGACAAGPVLQTEAPQPRPASLIPTPAPGTIIGQSAAQLTAQFGVPSARFSEGTARKLQFAGPLCVLDAYLYPPASGREPAVTHIDARRPSGEDFDSAACIAALRLRAAPR